MTLHVDSGGSAEPAGLQGTGLTPSCVVRWQPVLTGTWLNSSAGGTEILDSKYRLNSEPGALYSEVPRAKLWVCFKSPLRRTSVLSRRV